MVFYCRSSTTRTAWEATICSLGLATRQLHTSSMDQIGEGLENVGLAEMINQGLKERQQREPTWPEKAVIDAKHSALVAGGEEALHKTRLGRHVMDVWLKAAYLKSPCSATWDGFSKSKAMEARGPINHGTFASCLL
jgi:hypothetical protein